MSEEPKTAPSPNPNPNRNRRRRRKARPSTEAGGEPAGQVQTAAQPTKHEPARGEARANKANPEGRQRQQRARGNNQRGGKRNPRNTNPEVVPPVTAPPNRGRTKRPLAEPRIGVGCVVLRGDEVLLVRERGRWSLPKGGLEVGEMVQVGARRETYEETGLIVELRDLAFIVEFQAETWGHHLQFFYVGREVGGVLEPRDPDRDVQEAKFVPIRQLREYLRFRPRLVSLETWLRDRRPRHFVFDLEKEPAMLRKRRRVDPGRIAARKQASSEDGAHDHDDELEDEQP